MPRRKRRKARVWVLKMDGVPPIPRPSVDDVALDLVLGAHEIVGTAPPHALIPVGKDRSFRADMTVAWQAHALDVDVGHWASVKKQEVFSTLKLPRWSELIRKELIDLGIHAMAELAWALEEGDPGARQPSLEREQTALEDEPIAGQPRRERLQTTLTDEQEEEAQINHTESLAIKEGESVAGQLSQELLQATVEGEQAEEGQPGKMESLALEEDEQGEEGQLNHTESLVLEEDEPEEQRSSQGESQNAGDDKADKGQLGQGDPEAALAVLYELVATYRSIACLFALHQFRDGFALCQLFIDQLEALTEAEGISSVRQCNELDPRLAELRRFLDSCIGQVSATPFPFSKDTRPEVDGRTLRGRRRKQREQGTLAKDKAKGRARHSATVADTAAPTSTSARTKAISTGGKSATRVARSNDRGSDTGSAHDIVRDSDSSRAHGTVRDSVAAGAPATANTEPTQGTGTEAQADPRKAAITAYLDKPLEALVCSALLPHLALIWCRCFERVHYESLEAHHWWELAADGTLTMTTPASFSSGYTALKEAVAAEADRVMQASGTGLPYPDPLYAMPLFPKSPTKPAHLADVISVSEQAKRLAQLLNLQVVRPAG